MNAQPAQQPRSSTNGYGRRRPDWETGYRLDKIHSGRSLPSSGNSGFLNGSRLEGLENPSRDRLIYLAACLVGHCVEVQVKNGSMFSGIFHATNVEKDFGIILKMAHLVKDGPVRGSKPSIGLVGKHPSKTLIVPAKELVQVIAKDVHISSSGLTNGLVRDKRQDILIDSSISHPHIVEERQLTRWVPDENDPECPEIGDLLDGTWHRNWDQFQTNEELFGVKSTFDEELYTTKLERGPQTEELEREALRIAREIEGEATDDLHLAEERGHDICYDGEVDEEIRFSSVARAVMIDGDEPNDNVNVDPCSVRTSTDSSSCSPWGSFVAKKGGNDGDQPTSNSSLDSSSLSTRVHSISSCPCDVADQFNVDAASERITVSDLQQEEESRTTNCLGEAAVTSHVAVDVQGSLSEDERLSQRKKTLDKGGLSPHATEFIPSSSLCMKTRGSASLTSGFMDLMEYKKFTGDTVDAQSHTRSSLLVNGRVNSAQASSELGLSPSSSAGSLCSEKLTLHSSPKERRLNPNAKSFTPSSSLLKPLLPASEGPACYPSNISTVPFIHGVTIGTGVAPFAGHQQTAYSPQAVAVQATSGYLYSGAPLYGQQVLVGQSRPLFYVPSCSHEIHYK